MSMQFAVGNAAMKLREQPGYSNRDSVAWGDIDLLDAIASEAGLPCMHVLDRHKRILDALERDPRFEKFLFRCSIGNREGRVRAFRYRSTALTTARKAAS